MDIQTAAGLALEVAVRVYQQCELAKANKHACEALG